MNSKNKKFGLALGSGGARGLFHLGVLQVLEKEEIKIDFIAGSSIGALVGAMIAAGQSAKEIKNKIKESKSEILLSFLDPVVFKGGLLKGRKLKKLVNKLVGCDSFNDLSVPFAVVATDLISGKTITIDQGDLVEAVMASMAIPGIFKPVRKNDLILVDGGVSNPIPDDTVKNMGADLVLAVNLDYGLHRANDSGSYNLSINVGLRAFDLYRHYLSEFSTSVADIVLNPEIDDNSLVGISSILSEEKANKLMNMGEKYMMDEIDNLKSLL
jgi:NTE family protein